MESMEFMKLTGYLTLAAMKPQLNVVWFAFLALNALVTYRTLFLSSQLVKTDDDGKEKSSLNAKC